MQAAASWAPPLDRIVSFRAGEISLRDALDRLAATAHLRLSYSSETLELDRLVCVSFDSMPVGAVLARLLEGTRVQAVSAGGEHVVLAPAPGSYASVPAKSAVVLERIVVTGSAAGAARKPLPVAIDVIEGDEIASRSDGALTQSLNASVPGMFIWAQSPSSVLAQYGSIRGASSFGLTYPKIYIDGIQVANPLVVTRLTPEAVDHIEVIRGPQGAALYGADAISGVANIVMRKETAAPGAPRARLRSGLGLSNSEYSANPSLGQDHVFGLRTGSNTRSLGGSLEFGSTGAYIPGAYQRHFAVNGAARSVGAQSIFTGVLRLFGERAGSPTSPLLPATVPQGQPIDRAAVAQSVFQYTAGTTFKVTDGDRLTHSLVAGVDGYMLSGVRDDRGPIPSSADAALLAAQGNATRGTIRMSSVAHVVRSERFSTDLTLVGEQSILHQSIVASGDQPRSWDGSAFGGIAAPGMGGTGTVTVVSQPIHQWRNNTGASAQLNTGILDHLFLTGGLRVERASGADRMAALPMVGASWVLERGIASLKFRGAYGKGIRWPETAARETLWARTHPEIGDGTLAPEEQAGVEAGIDLLLGRVFALQVTRFDQVASGLIQRVMVRADSAPGPGSGSWQIGYQMQNVGEVTNRGWEMQGTFRQGPLSLTGTLSLADSRVRRLTSNYTGDLTAGDRMLDVPARTIGFTAAWSAKRWAASVTGYRAEDWISYDRLALLQVMSKARDGSNSGPVGTIGTVPNKHGFVGPTLRQFWMTYAGVTHLRASVMRSIRQGMALTLTADNLLDEQRGEPDNVTVLPGRTISVGLRAEF